MYSIIPTNAFTIVSPPPLPTTSSSRRTSAYQYWKSSLGGVIRSSQLCVASPVIVIFFLLSIFGATSAVPVMPRSDLTGPSVTLRSRDPHSGQACGLPRSGGSPCSMRASHLRQWTVRSDKSPRCE